MAPSGGATMEVDQPMMWSPVNRAFSSTSSKQTWFMVWPGVLDRAQRVARAFESLAVAQFAVGAMVEVVGGVELVDLAQGHVARRENGAGSR